MKIATVDGHPYCLPLRRNWLTAAGAFSERQGWLLRLTSECGRQGYGDLAPLPGPGAVTASGSQLPTLAAAIVGLPAERALRALDDCHGVPAAARLAMETALLDLLAQGAGVSLAAFLRGPLPVVSRRREAAAPAVNAALGAVCRVDEQAVRSACHAGFRVLKLKVGLAAIEVEIRRLRWISDLLTAGVQWRLDANRAWDAAQAKIFLRNCADLPIEMIEEPLRQPTLARLQALQARTAIAIAVDESLPVLGEQALLASPAIRRLVLKPTRLGGLRCALALAGRARQAGVDCIVTSSLDSACGVTAAAHLAAALDNRLAHGLATSAWLAADTGAAPTIRDGQLHLPAAAGLGFTPHAGTAFSPVTRAAANGTP